MKPSDRCYLRSAYIRNQGLRHAYGAWRVVRADARMVELEAWYRADLQHARLRKPDGTWSEPVNSDPGRLVAPAAATWV